MDIFLHHCPSLYDATVQPRGPRRWCHESMSKCTKFIAIASLVWSYSQHRSWMRMLQDCGAYSEYMYSSFSGCYFMLTTRIISVILVIQPALCGSDLDAMYNNSLKFSIHVDRIETKLIFYCFRFRDPILFTKAFYTFVRPVLGYPSTTWNPHCPLDFNRTAFTDFVMCVMF